MGKKQLIEGMDKALVGMCVNERRLVKIPPKLAYGKEGHGECVLPEHLISQVCVRKRQGLFTLSRVIHKHKVQVYTDTRYTKSGNTAAIIQLMGAKYNSMLFGFGMLPVYVR